MMISAFLRSDQPLTGVQRLEYERLIITPHASPWYFSDR